MLFIPYRTRLTTTCLCYFPKPQEQRWKTEYRRLKQEVLMLRQQQVLLNVSSGRSIYDSPPASGMMLWSRRKCHFSLTTIARGFYSHCLDGLRGQEQQNQQSALGLMALTPPDSQSTSPTVTTSTAVPYDHDGMEFLRAYFFLEHQLRSRSADSILENDVIRQSVLAVLEHVDRSLQLNRSDFPRCLESLSLCIRLLDRHSKWIPVIRENFLRTSTIWLESISRGNALKPFALLQILAESEMAPLLSETLLKLLAESQLRLKEWDVTAFIPQPLLDILSATSYYMLLIEKALPRLSPGDRKRLVKLSSGIDPQIQLHFPLFASALIRLQGLLSA